LYHRNRFSSGVRMMWGRKSDYSEIGVENRDYHQLFHFEIGGAKRISQYRGQTVSGQVSDYLNTTDTPTVKK
jgi:hypothetical protein